MGRGGGKGEEEEKEVDLLRMKTGDWFRPSTVQNPQRLSFKQHPVDFDFWLSRHCLASYHISMAMIADAGVATSATKTPK